mgnify:CR=1 FL=1
MKKHLNNVIRKDNKENKSLFKVVLTQNERNLKLPDTLFKNFLNTIKQKDLFFYPDITKLKLKLAKFLGVKQYNLLITPGSDIGIKTIFESFDLKNKNIITSNYCFPMYSVYADLYQAKLKKVRYTNRGLNFRWLLDKIDKDTQFIIIANPNSPLGDYYSFDQIKILLDILVQISGILEVGLEEFEFCHNDIFPWNVILTPCDKPRSYFTKQGVWRSQGPYKVVLLDFGKSHVVYKNIHRGLIKPYTTSTIQDIIILIVSVCSTLLSQHCESRTLTFIFDLMQFLSREPKYCPEFRTAGHIRKFTKTISKFFAK